MPRMIGKAHAGAVFQRGKTMIEARETGSNRNSVVNRRPDAPMQMDMVEKEGYSPIWWANRLIDC